MFNRWTEEELDLLKKYYNKLDHSILKKSIPNHTWLSIKEKARVLGLSRKRVAWTDLEDSIIKENYSTMPIKELSNLFSDRSFTSVKQRCIDLGLRKKSSDRWSQEEEQYLVNNYWLKSSKEIAKRLNRTLGAVISKAKDLDINGDHEYPKRLLSCDRQYFGYLRPEQAYWAGFIAADGCLHKKSNTLSFHLQRRDKHHLELFSKCVNYNGQCYEDITTKGPKKFNAASLIISGVSGWFHNLDNFYNITPNKTYTLSAPDIRDISLLKSYISGYIDGDGTLYFRKNGNITLSLIGTKKLLNFIKDFFDVHYPVVFNMGYAKVSNRRTCKDSIGLYQIQGRRAINILTDLCNLDIPRLERKWNRFYNDVLNQQLDPYIPRMVRGVK